MLLELEEREEEAGAGSWVCVLFWTTSAIAEQQQCVWGSEISSSLVRHFGFVSSSVPGNFTVTSDSFTCVPYTTQPSRSQSYSSNNGKPLLLV
jgi:hypothetical protein